MFNACVLYIVLKIYFITYENERMVLPMISPIYAQCIAVV